VRAWEANYQCHGLVVIGVHSPEFPFERNAGNVRRALRELQIAYPVALDNDYSIWRALGNEHWPAFYFIDVQGRIRYYHYGEGQFARSEENIQALLTEAGNRGFAAGLVTIEPAGIEAPADFNDLGSRETYVGYARGGDEVAQGGLVADKCRIYSAPQKLALNQWAFSGDWTVHEHAAVLNTAGGGIAYCFHARDLHLVMGPTTSGSPVLFRVLLDGRPPGTGHGLDVDADGYGVITEPRLYQLIRQAGQIADRRFEIAFLEPGAAVYVFMFG
jgi:hypothetical protein